MLEARIGDLCCISPPHWNYATLSFSVKQKRSRGYQESCLRTRSSWLTRASSYEVFTQPAHSRLLHEGFCSYKEIAVFCTLRCFSFWKFPGWFCQFMRPFAFFQNFSVSWPCLLSAITYTNQFSLMLGHSELVFIYLFGDVAHTHTTVCSCGVRTTQRDQVPPSTDGSWGRNPGLAAGTLTW